MPQTLPDWAKGAQIAASEREGIIASERERIKALEREVKALLRANEILKTASAFFAQGSSAANSNAEALYRQAP